MRPTSPRYPFIHNAAPYALPKLFLHRGSRRLDFLAADDAMLVIPHGALSHKEFWLVDLRSGERALANLELGPISEGK